MTRKNRYVCHAHLSPHQFRQLLRLFALDLEATKVANLTGLNRNTVNRYFLAIRQRIARACEQDAPLRGAAEVDESSFGPRRVKGKRGRGAGSKTIVFGIYKRNGKVYTEIVPDVKKRTLQAILRGKVARRSIIHSDSWRDYDGLVDVDYRKYHRIHHGDNVFARGRGIHINDIESFWGTAKTRLAKRRGIRSHLFHVHLKECEFRFNHRHENLYTVLLEMFRTEPLTSLDRC
jgi:transposase-like protein